MQNQESWCKKCVIVSFWKTWNNVSLVLFSRWRRITTHLQKSTRIYVFSRTRCARKCFALILGNVMFVNPSSHHRCCYISVKLHMQYYILLNGRMVSKASFPYANANHWLRMYLNASRNAVHRVSNHNTTAPANLQRWTQTHGWCKVDAIPNLRSSLN